MMDLFVLEGKTPRHEPDTFKWAAWFETADRTVAYHRFDKVQISTVFLGIDHSFGYGPMKLFETMAWVDGEVFHCERYTIWDEAAAGHHKLVKEVQTMIAKAEKI